MQWALLTARYIGPYVGFAHNSQYSLYVRVFWPNIGRNKAVATAISGFSPKIHQ